MGRGKPSKGAPGVRGETRSEDRALWEAVKASVTPMARDTVAQRGLGPAAADPSLSAAAPKPAPQPAKTKTPPPPAAQPAPAPPAPQPPLMPGRPAGVDRRTAERLRRGRLPIDGRLDLHGMSREAAHTAVVDYIGAAHDRGKRCVVVVTGKGRGILKDSLPHWLNLPPLRAKILAVERARPEHGGEGAVYVLLKRRRRPPMASPT